MRRFNTANQRFLEGILQKCTEVDTMITLFSKYSLEGGSFPRHLRGLGLMEKDVHAVLRHPQVSCHYGEYLSSMGFVLLLAKFACWEDHEDVPGSEVPPMHMKKALAHGASLPPNNIGMSGIT